MNHRLEAGATQMRSFPSPAVYNGCILMRGTSLMTTLAEWVGSNPRVLVVKDGALVADAGKGCVIYWMQRSQRGKDNPALNLAVELGNTLLCPVLTVFAITPSFPDAQRRHYKFLADGLLDIEHDLKTKNVPFLVRVGAPNEIIAAVCAETNALAVISDENPLRVGRFWRDRFAKETNLPYARVDSDVVVPTSLFPKEEYAARTIRPKIHEVWDTFLKAVPNPKAAVDWDEGLVPLPKGESLEPSRLMPVFKVGGVSEVAGYPGGSRAAEANLKRFLTRRLPKYANGRNLPVPYMTSELSAHLHFGQISVVTIALAARESGAPAESVEAYLEELIVRRELAINFVSRNDQYDTIQGCPSWALATLEKHAGDKREYLYSLEQFEAAETHDPVWNAAQKEMVVTGRMHNYLRMYWAKKILEWSPNATAAFQIAIGLNDKYEMDGRDPNGFTGVAWAIAGKHDRPWPERPVYGTIRSMTQAGLRKKFDADAYIRWVETLEKKV